MSCRIEHLVAPQEPVCPKVMFSQLGWERVGK